MSTKVGESLKRAYKAQKEQLDKTPYIVSIRKNPDNHAALERLRENNAKTVVRGKTRQG